MESPLNTSQDLAGRAALVTGAASGIGRATALALARAGASILCFDLADPAPVTAEIAALGGQAVSCRGSVVDEAAVEAAVAQCEADLGPLAILVNSAGIVEFGGLEDAEVERMREILEVNLLGPMIVLKHGLGAMRRHGEGSAIVVGSASGRNGGIRSGPAYGGSKGGVLSFVKWAAKAYAEYGVRVNTVAPGPVETPMTDGAGYTTEGIPLGRLGQPEDIAPAILYLASPASSWVTGQTLDVNGGVYMN
jgi:NAD(P)-dependent dehydrogenase (short-subunit alcohol dehydrogenase family)